MAKRIKYEEAVETWKRLISREGEPWEDPREVEDLESEELIERCEKTILVAPISTHSHAQIVCQILRNAFIAHGAWGAELTGFNSMLAWHEAMAVAEQGGTARAALRVA